MEEHKRLMLMDLQFFAKDGPGGEKTEEPTEKKLSDSRKEGQVAKGKELSNAVSLIALFLVLQFGTAKLGNQLLTIFTIVYNKRNRSEGLSHLRQAFFVGCIENLLKEIIKL